MFRVSGRAAITAVVLMLAACTPPPVAKTPKTPPEPTQSPPSAEALGPVRIAEQGCEEPPANGDVLEGDVDPEAQNYYEITNLSTARAIVKIRRGEGGPLVVAVYVAPGKTASIGPLPDGVYRQTYAMGREWAGDCLHLDAPSGYGQYDQSDTFQSKTTDEGQEGRTQTYSLEESDVDGGEGKQALSADKFNAP